MMAGLLALDVVLRNFLQPVQIIPELSVFAMIIVAYLGLSACEQKEEHIQIDFFLSQLSGKPHIVFLRLRQMLAAIGVIVFLYAILLNGIGSFLSGEGTEGMVTIKIWPIKLLMLAGTAVFLYEILRKLFSSAVHSQPLAKQGVSELK